MLVLGFEIKITGWCDLSIDLILERLQAISQCQCLSYVVIEAAWLELKSKVVQIDN